MTEGLSSAPVPLSMGRSMAEACEDDDCAICLLAPPALDTPLRLTSCGHAFCEHCIGQYALKLMPPHVAVPCPLCRTPLSTSELPAHLVLSVQVPPNRTIGLTLERLTGADHVSIASVAPGSVGSTLGLRSGMQVVAIDGIEITTTGQLAAHIRRTDSQAVRLTIGKIRPPVPEAQRMLSQGQQARLAQEESARHWASCCCCCNLVGQIFQRAICPERRWVCYLISVVLWTLYVGNVLCEQVATYDYRRYAETQNTSEYERNSHLFLLGLEEWGSVDYSDGLNVLSEIAATISAACTLLCWLLGSSLLMCARNSLRRHEPDVWARAMEGAEPSLVRHFAAPWAPFCLCCSLARRLLYGLLPNGPFNVCYPLPPGPGSPAQPAPRGLTPVVHATSTVAVSTSAVSPEPMDSERGRPPAGHGATGTEMVALSPRAPASAPNPPTLPPSPPPSDLWPSNPPRPPPSAPFDSPELRYAGGAVVLEVLPEGVEAAVGARVTTTTALPAPAAEAMPQWLAWLSPGGTTHHSRPQEAATVHV